MKFTYEDLAKAMGLKVGDRIKFYSENCVINENYRLCNERTNVSISITNLINEEFKILPQKKKVGELKCYDLFCVKCPLYPIYPTYCENTKLSSTNRLYDILENFNEEYHDQEIYDIFKKRLDKEVK